MSEPGTESTQRDSKNKAADSVVVAGRDRLPLACGVCDLHEPRGNRRKEAQLQIRNGKSEIGNEQGLRPLVVPDNGQVTINSLHERWLPLLVLAALIGSIGAAHFAMRWHLPLPFCWLRKFTGIPCPACGCTRSLVAWSQFDPVQAFQFNPLFFLACVGVALWALVWGLEKAAGKSWLPRAYDFLQGRSLWKLVALLAGLNWVYLCLKLPK